MSASWLTERWFFDREDCYLETQMNREIEQANELLRCCGDVAIQIAEYRATHGYLHILMTDSGFERKGDVYLTDCEYISGPTSGGPFAVAVFARHDGAGVELRTAGGEFSVRAGRVRVELGEGRR